MALLAATSARDVARLRELLAGGAPLEARDERGYTAFLLACKEGQAECAEVLLAAGCDVAAASDRGGMALMLAAANGHAALLPRLLAGGAPREARNKDGVTAFLWACNEGTQTARWRCWPRAATPRP